MRNFEKVLNIFSTPETIEKTKVFLNNFFLDDPDAEEEKKTVFHRNSSSFSEPIFNAGFTVNFWDCGILFLEEEYENLCEVLKRNGTKYIFVIQNENFAPIIGGDIRHPLLNFRFPIEASWDELNSGGEISDELFRPYKDYYVFSDNGVWGKYVSGERMLSLVGYKNSEFANLYKLTPDEIRKFKEYIPPNIWSRLPAFVKDFLE